MLQLAGNRKDQRDDDAHDIPVRIIMREGLPGLVRFGDGPRVIQRFLPSEQEDANDEDG